MIDKSKLLPEFRPLLAEDRLNELGPGTPNIAVRAALQQLQRDFLASPKVRDRDFAMACLAGLWLHHDFFDESHAISQDLHTVEGSYWHGILHRREPDPSNAAYWFRRVGEHPIFAPLAKEAQDLGLRLRSDRWSPFDFIDLCEKHRGTGAEHEMQLRRVQQREWELLFEWCFQRATK
jgi:hypothetical protein